MAQLLKFYRVATLPATGVQGGLYFVTGEGILYVYNGTAFEAYSGLKDAAVTDNVLKITKHDGSVLEYKAADIAQALINDLDVTDTEVAGQYVSQVSQTDGKISVKRTALPSVADTAVEGQYVSAVSEVNGKITVTRAALPTESVDVDSLDGATGAITTLKGQTATGSVNLEVVGGQLKATLVGSFADGAQVNKLEGVKLNGTTLPIDGDKTVDVTAIEGIVSGDKVLSKNGNNIQSTLNMSYDSTAKKIYLKGVADTVISEINAADFIKDGMLSSGELVWCTIAADGTHTEVAEGTPGAVHCLKLVLNADGGAETIHIPLNELCDIYTGEAGQVNVSANNVISLADKTVTESTGTALTPAHGGSFNVVTDVTYDSKGRIAGVETSQVTLPTIEDGEKTGDGTFVDVTVKTVGGVVTEVAVSENDIASAAALATLDAEVQDHELVVSAALNDLNARIEGHDDRIEALEAGLGAVEHTTVSDGNTTDFVDITETTEGSHKNYAVSATVIKSTNGGDAGLATDAYVREQIATTAMVWEEGSF